MKILNRIIIYYISTNYGQKYFFSTKQMKYNECRSYNFICFSFGNLLLKEADCFLHTRNPFDFINEYRCSYHLYKFASELTEFEANILTNDN